jgi:hypothetical protein
MTKSRHQDAGQNHNKIYHRAFENVEKFRHLRTIVTNQITERISPGNACYCSIHNVLSSLLIPKNLMITVYEIIHSPVVLVGCKTWSLTSREELD